MASNRGFSPWLEDADVTLYHGDVLSVLPELPAEFVDCVVTSPPYWGLRDYGQEGQLGLEPTPEQYVERMVEVFREVRRVLAPHGTVWLNLGDSYAAGKSGRTDHGSGDPTSRLGPLRNGIPGGTPPGVVAQRSAPPGFKPKDLVGVPWRVAFALQADGWWLRSAITWCKPNCMPESVTDRPTKATEMVFLLTKAPRYYYDAEAVREPHKHDGRHVTTVQGQNGSIQHRDGERWPGTGRNMRDWWEIATQPYPDAHFATFPEELARRCIAAGTSERGKCPKCGAPWVRELEKEANGRVRQREKGGLGTEYRRESHGLPAVGGEFQEGVVYTTVGWRQSCACPAARSVPAVVLDPFVGSGTVCHVARKLNRHSIGIDLNESYLELAARRLQQQSLFAEAL